jgi:hypothetical protein
MARINIRLEDGLLERVKGAVPEGQMSAWLVGLMEVALDGPKQEDLTIARVMKRLDALEDPMRGSLLRWCSSPSGGITVCGDGSRGCSSKAERALRRHAAVGRMEVRFLPAPPLHCNEGE